MGQSSDSGPDNTGPKLYGPDDTEPKIYGPDDIGPKFYANQVDFCLSQPLLLKLGQGSV